MAEMKMSKIDGGTIPDNVIRFDDDDGGYWIDCWKCGGAGFHEDECVCQAFEDTCCCLEPEPPACEECKGTGELHCAACKGGSHGE